MTVIHPGTSNPAGTAAREATGASDGRDVTAGGGIERVNAFDGLFLRAEHLDRIQDYAHELATALGVAGGPGAVEGYGVTVVEGTLVVQPGLAIDAHGRPLRSRRNLTRSLDGLELGDTEFYLVEIRRTAWDFGSEAVQGVLCEDPCSGGGTARPYRAEGVMLHLEPASEPQLAGIQDDERRSWLASRLFAAEREDGDAWPDRGQPQLARQSWSPPSAPEARPAGVRLAVLRSSGDAGWTVDIWAARRDRGAPPPVRAWQHRLGMRPWDVFVAQILQFQDHLAAVWADAPGGAKASYVAELLGALGEVGASVMKVTRKVTMERLDRLTEAVKKGEIGEVGAFESEVVTLPSLGFRELPPAGFLPYLGSPSAEQVASRITDLLGGQSMVDIRVCTGSLGDVGGMIDHAQHRDRIPLAEGGRVPVDVLVVDGTGEVYDWVTFARREDVDCGQGGSATDRVDVYIVSEDDQKDLYQSYLDYIEWHRNRRTHEEEGDEEPEQPDLPPEKAMTLSYPARTWALPADDGYDNLVTELRYLVANRRVDVVSVATDDARRTLLVGRAGILAALCTESNVEGPRPVSFVGDTEAEAIVVLHGDQGRVTPL
ncbi:MAG TPA: hypothetical protein VFU54_16725 [Actinomycetota bacterium]|nr:hypothetical protein [Actinomycetota bacterium]